MRRITVAYVDSSKDKCKRYVVIKRGTRLECNCLDFFFKEDRDTPCRHITQVLKTKFCGDKVDHLKSIVLTPKGERVLRYLESRRRSRGIDVSAAFRMASATANKA